jgi:glycosyltransferase involved in cell wall biosynthesis
VSTTRLEGAADGSGARSRDLLVVTYHFPPIQSAGVYRMVGLVKYLAARGWRITVLSVQRSTHEGGDDESLALIPPGIDVIRTVSPEPAARLLRAFGKRGANAQATYRGAESGTGGVAGQEPIGESHRETKTLVRRFLARPGRWLVDALSYPDYQIGWAPRVARDVRAFVRRRPGTIVLSSTPPHSTQLGVRWARVFSRFVWVADFRDPWTAPLRQPKGRANLALQRALERWVLAGLNGVIVNTEGNRERLLAAFPRLDPKRVSVVTNAFDTETLPPAAAAGDPALACDIAYFGEVYPGMFDVYLDAARILLARDAKGAPRLHVFGKVGAADVRRVSESGLASHVVFMGSVSYPRSLSLMQSARSLLLLLPPGESMATCVPSKLYPYLFSDRPVFALVPRGDAARVVEETAAGEVVAPDDAPAVAARLAAFVARVRNGEAPPPAVLAERRAAYAMEHVAERVDRFLREVSDGR